jgi:multidrug efflux pump subunit AcrB
VNIAEFCLKQRTVTVVLTMALFVAGLVSYQRMSRLEDPEFTIKDALVITPYPGASAAEVEEEVTDRIEKAAQELGQVDKLESKSDRGLSTVTVSAKDKYDKTTLPQVWEQLRRKINDVQGKLPPGAGPSLVVDDYGDVYGVFFVLYGEDFSYAELKRIADLLRKELLLVKDVAKINAFGEQREAIYVELRQDRLTQLGIPSTAIYDELKERNVVRDSGHVRVGEEFITLSPTGEFSTLKDFENLLIRAGDKQFYLKEVANIRRGYVDPSTEIVRYDGHPAIALGISTVSGGNVVAMGSALREKMKELAPQLPVGVEFGIISMQSEAVTKAIKGFTTSLLQAVAIVIVVLVFFMGLRSSLIIGAVLLVTIVGSFTFLIRMGVALERISLGALIIALGMLVDNAIVVVDGILIGLKRGEAAAQAAIRVVRQSAVPLLAATVIAVLAFAAIGTSQDSTGEFCRSLFQVILVSLLLSWVTAVTFTPLLGVWMLKLSKKTDASLDPFDTPFYRFYRRFLRICIRFRWFTVAVVAATFFLALFGFRFVEQSFFPPSTRPQFMIDVWLPQGTHIDETVKRVDQMEKDLLQRHGVTHVSSLIGKGGLRFLLTYTPEKQNPAYAQFLVDVENAGVINRLVQQVDRDWAQAYPDVLSYAFKFELGPGANGKIRARFIGDDPKVLRQLGDQTMVIIAEDPNARATKNDWRNQVKIFRPVISEEAASRAGIQRRDVAHTLREAFEGQSVGVFRESDLLLPIIARDSASKGEDAGRLMSLQIWSPAANKYIPLSQVVQRVEMVFEDEIIYRRDRKRTLTILTDPVEGVASKLFNRLRPKIEAIPLPAGYKLQWGGEYEDSNRAKGALVSKLPVFLALMVLTTIALFNNLRQPLVIWLCVPLALIGVTLGLLVTKQPFGFMALLGLLSLIGMLIKNAIVLVDEINVQTAAGNDPLTALLNSGTNRLMPVAMAASTTALGMLPLIVDAFFVSMAVSIIFGLMCATVLTMVVLPVFYAILFRIPARAT